MARTIYEVAYWNGVTPAADPSWRPPAKGQPARPFPTGKGVALSLGCGVDSWAMAILLCDPEAGQALLDEHFDEEVELEIPDGLFTFDRMIDPDWKPDYLHFAETGNEKPETYEFINEVITPWTIEHQVPFFRLKRIDTKYDHLYHEFSTKGTIPFYHGMPHTCSKKWKVEVLQGFQKDTFPLGCHIMIGFNADEYKRSMRSSSDDSDECHYMVPYCNQPYVKGQEEGPAHMNMYPMQILGLDRDDEKKVIQAAGLEVPVKSACFICPSMKKHELEQIYNKHPELWKAVVHMEDEFHRVSITKGRKEWGGRFQKGWKANSWENGRRLMGTKSVREMEKTFLKYDPDRTPAFENRPHRSHDETYEDARKPIPSYRIPLPVVVN